MTWQQFIIFAWLAITGLLELALINKDYENVKTSTAGLKMLQDPPSGLDVKTFSEQLDNHRSNAMYKTIGYTIRMFATRIFILWVLHSGGFW